MANTLINLNDFEFYINSNITENNQTAFTKCLIHHFEELTFSLNDSYCPTSFDSVLCWPRTAAGLTAYLPCMEKLVGLRYDTSKNATRYCHLNGTWNAKTNYEGCNYINEITQPEADFGIAELTSITYSIGYLFSLASLILGLFVFTYFH